MTLKRFPYSTDAGLLLLRVWVGASLFMKHGFEKPTNFAQMAAHFPDPLHIGPVPSLIFALVSDAICSLLVAAGLLTRWAALWICINLLAAWGFVHHFLYFGKGADHGETMVLYLGVYVTLAIAGPGKFSLDYKLRR
jgi:putative oxidoreductase